jgi:hypothetical protein
MQTEFSMKMVTVMWDVVPCSLVEVYQCIKGVCYHCHQAILMMQASRTSEVSLKLLPDYIVQHPRRQLSSSFSLLWKPEISQNSVYVHVLSKYRTKSWKKLANEFFDNMA